MLVYAKCSLGGSPEQTAGCLFAQAPMDLYFQCLGLQPVAAHIKPHCTKPGSAPMCRPQLGGSPHSGSTDASTQAAQAEVASQGAFSGINIHMRKALQHSKPTCMARRAPTSRFSVEGTTLRSIFTAMRSSSSVSTSSQEDGPSRYDS